MFFDRYLSFIIICCSLFLWFVDWFRYVCGEDDDKKETTKVTKKCVLLNVCQLKITSLLVFFFFSFSRLLLLCVGSFKELPKINTAHRRFRNMPFGVWAKKNWREKQKHLLKTDFLYISMFFFLTPLIVNRSTRGVLIVTLLVVFFYVIVVLLKSSLFIGFCSHTKPKISTIYRFYLLCVNVKHLNASSRASWKSMRCWVKNHQSTIYSFFFIWTRQSWIF